MNRLVEIERRRAWCEAWANRPEVTRPQVTPEWRALLDDVAWLLNEVRTLNYELRAAQR